MSFWHRHKKKLPEPEKYFIYRHVHDCPAKIFYVDCLIEKNIKALVRFGNPTDQQVNEAWMSLCREYQQAAGDKNVLHGEEMARQIGDNWCRLLKIRLCIQVLFYRYDPDKVRELHRLGYTKYRLDFDDKGSYYKDLNHILTQSKMIEITINQQTKEYEKILQQFNKEDLTHEKFNLMVADMNKFQSGFPLDLTGVTVGMFIAVQQRMRDYVKAKEREIAASRIPHR